MALLRTVASSRIFTRSASKNTTGYSRSRGRLCHAVTSATMPSVTVLIRSGETSTAYHLREKALNLAHGHAPRVEREHLVVKAGEAPLVLRDQPRLERPVAIAGHLKGERAVVGQHRLSAGSVAMVGDLSSGFVPPGRIAQVMRQLAAQRALDDQLLEPTDRHVELLGRERPLANESIENLRGNGRQGAPQGSTTSVCGA